MTQRILLNANEILNPVSLGVRIRV